VSISSKMKMRHTCVLLIVCGLSCAHAALDLSAAKAPYPLAETKYTGYPATFPYEDETIVPTSPPESSPSFSFDDDDAGGYAYAGWNIDLNDYEMPWGYHLCPAFDYLAAAEWEVTIFSDSGTYNLGVQQWNCSTAETVLYYTQADFLGEMGGEALPCKADGCCSDWIGKMKAGSDQLEQHETWTGLWKSGGCDLGALTEAQYCGYVDGSAHSCIEYWVSQTERSFVYPCPDNAVRYWMACPLYKVSGLAKLPEVKKMEPAQYLEKVTVEESFNVYPVLNFWDRQCAPYSYYNPAESASASDSATMSICIAQLLAATTAVFQLLA